MTEEFEIPSSWAPDRPHTFGELVLRAIDWLGEVHPRWAQALDLPHAPVVFELDAEAVSERIFPHPREQSRQPVAVRDLAIWVDADVPWQSLLDTLQQRIAADEALSVVKDIKLFDIWREAATARQRSLALRLWFQGRDATLEDRQVEHCVQSLLDALTQVHGARLRS